MTQWSSSASGSLGEMPDSNPGSLPQKSGVLPMSHYISFWRRGETQKISKMENFTFIYLKVQFRNRNSKRKPESFLNPKHGQVLQSCGWLLGDRLFTSDSESSPSMPSLSSVLTGWNPSLLRPRMSPTFQFFFLLDSANSLPAEVNQMRLRWKGLSAPRAVQVQNPLHCCSSLF